MVHRDGGRIGLITYTDWQVASNISVGYLYFFPLVLAGVTIRHRGASPFPRSIGQRCVSTPRTQCGPHDRGRVC